MNLDNLKKLVDEAGNAPKEESALTLKFKGLLKNVINSLKEQTR